MDIVVLRYKVVFVLDFVYDFGLVKMDFGIECGYVVFSKCSVFMVRVFEFCVIMNGIGDG